MREQVAYAAIFTWTGLVSTRQLDFGLIYIFLWEGLISTLLVGIRYLNILAYALAMLHGMDEKTFAVLSKRVMEFPAEMSGAAVAVVFF